MLVEIRKVLVVFHLFIKNKQLCDYQTSYIGSAGSIVLRLNNM